MSKYDVSIVVIAYNEEKYLPILLGSIKKQKTKLSIEIVLVDDNSTDRTVEIATESGCRVLYNNDVRANLQHMRNIGLWNAGGEAVIFCDSDVALSDNYIERMCGPIIEGKYDTVLCKTYAILEAYYDILPEVYSKSYAWYLKHAPRFMVKRFPVQLFKWLALWIKTMLKEKKLVSIWTIPNRSHTTGIATRGELARNGGGWRAISCLGDDARYSYDVFNQSSKIIWDRKCTLFISKRRVFPKNNSWIINALFGWAIKIIQDIKKVDEGNYKEQIR